MNLAELDEVHYDLDVDGEQVRRQLARQIWEDRGWATVAVAFQERDHGGEWKPAKVALLRFRRIHEMWKKQAGITLSLADARALASTIAGWEL
ncbi:MAG TPA: hypothetical protein VIV11_07100 [Kofleriaceae bacterium]